MDTKHCYMEYCTSNGKFLTSTGVNNQGRYYEFDVTAYVKTQFAGDKQVFVFKRYNESK